ncbi:uncharacterized protein LOC119458591 isoform X2 [Dermacentor silvarum]|uniref:uncharacterized protein LOC119458591 isoform X2 n=1 Tax=Dermacentor silvarum TaxID=543639 RepID=UPI002100B22A|nr:uncharacterized protein LOC119458591 isoform X2 [Dermacentor silvarum]
MLPSHLLLALLLLTSLAMLPAPADGTLGVPLGLMLPAALIGLPFGPLALGIGAVGIKIAILSRIIAFLAGIVRNRGPQRGISVRKEFVHIPVKNLQQAPIVAPGPPRSLAHAFSLPSHQPYGFPGGLHAAFARGPASPFQVPVPQPFAFSRPPQFVPPPPPFHFVVPPRLAVVRPEPTQDLSPDKILHGAQPPTGGTFDQLLRIAQSPAVSTIVNNNPDLVVKFIQGIAGSKSLQTPIGNAHSIAGLTGSKVGGGDIEALLNFVRQDPNLVRNIVRADPGFVPSLVNNILGIPGQAQEPTPAPPANFSGFDSKQPINDTVEGSSDVPANVPVDTKEAEVPTVRPSAAPKTAVKPPASSSPGVYSIQGYPQTFYNLPNYRPSPYAPFGYPAVIGEPQHHFEFPGFPWQTSMYRQDLNALKLAAYLSRASEKKDGTNAHANKQQSTVQEYGSVRKDKPKALPPTVVSTERPEKSTIEAYESVRKDTPKASHKTDATTQLPAVLESYGLLRKDKSKTTSPTTAATTQKPKQPAVQAYAPVRKTKPETSYQKVQPELKPAIPTYGSVKAKSKPSYQSQVVTESPATQKYGATRSGKPKPSYVASTGPAEPVVKGAAVVAEKPVIEQDLPDAKETKGDVYTSGQGSSPAVDGIGRPAVKEMAPPPSVRPVYVPATGKFRKDGKGGPEENVGSFPAALWDPTAFGNQDTKDSQSTGPAKSRVRRDSPDPTTTSPQLDLDDARTYGGRKCVFKMVCFIGANDHTYGRYGESASYVARYVDRLISTSDVADAYNRAYEVGRTHGGEGCRIKYNSCPMTVVDLISLSANFG